MISSFEKLDDWHWFGFSDLKLHWLFALWLHLISLSLKLRASNDTCDRSWMWILSLNQLERKVSYTSTWSFVLQADEFLKLFSNIFLGAMEVVCLHGRGWGTCTSPCSHCSTWWSCRGYPYSESDLVGEDQLDLLHWNAEALKKALVTDGHWFRFFVTVSATASHVVSSDLTHSGPGSKTTKEKDSAKNPKMPRLWRAY